MYGPAVPTQQLGAADVRSWGGQLAPAVDAGTALTVDRETHIGRIIRLNGTPTTITLPAAIGDGFEVNLVSTAAQAHVINAAAGDIFVGLSQQNDSGDSAAATMDAFPSIAATANNRITCAVATGLGTIGDRIRLINYAVNRWSVHALGIAATDPATVFSAV